MAQATKSKDTNGNTIDKILIGANHNGIALLGTRGNQSYERIVPNDQFKLIEAGVIAVDAAKLLGVIRTLNTQPVTLVSKQDGEHISLLIKSKRTRIHVREVSDGVAFPRTKNSLVDAITFPFNLGCLKEMLTAAAPTMPFDDGHISMRAMNLIVKDGFLSCSSVDGLRLTIAKAKLDEATAQMVNGLTIQALIPPRVISLISSLSAETETCKISISTNAISITVGSLRFQSNLVSTKFPDINKVLPTATVGTVIVDAAEFKGLLDRSKIAIDVSSDKSKFPPRLDMYFGVDKNIECKSMKNNVLIAEDCITASFSNLKSDVESSFNYNFLHSAIGVMRTPRVALTLSHNHIGKTMDTPIILITPVEQSYSFELMVQIMPMRK